MAKQVEMKSTNVAKKPTTLEALKAENEQLKEQVNGLNQACMKMYQQINQNNLGLVIERANAMLEIVKTDFFETDIRRKAAKEVESFWFEQIPNVLRGPQQPNNEASADEASTPNAE